MFVTRRGVVVVAGLTILLSMVAGLAISLTVLTHSAHAAPPFPSETSKTITLTTGYTCDAAHATIMDNGTQACLVDSTPMSAAPHAISFVCSQDSGVTWLPGDQCSFKITNGGFYYYTQMFATRWNNGNLQLLMTYESWRSDTLPVDTTITYSAIS